MVTTYKAGADGVPVIDKAPLAILDYIENWIDWLASGETIASNVVTVPTGITNTLTTATTTGVTVWLSGGTIGVTYLVTVKITSSAGRTDERSFRVRVVRR